MKVLDAIKKVEKLESTIDTLNKVLNKINKSNEFNKDELRVVSDLKNEKTKELSILTKRIENTKLGDHIDRFFL